MSRRDPRDVAASVRQRLLNRARAEGQEFQLILTHYGIERFLYRLQQSRHARRFVIKGAMLFRVWEGRSPRQTRDLDLLGYDDPDGLADTFAEIATVPVTPEDGLRFDPASVRSEPIRDHSEYRGVRVRLEASLGNARIPLQVDVGFGDAVTPPALEAEYPALLDLPAPVMRMYPPETVVAEKFHGIVSLSTANTRVKDYFDLARLAEHYEFDGSLLSRAVQQTFQRRDTALPDATPAGLNAGYLEDPARMRQWEAFVQRSTGGPPATTLSGAGALITTFVMPATVTGFSGRWTGGGPWQNATAR